LSEVFITVHRATKEIGGNCVEISTKGCRIILDVGRPLDARSGQQGLLAATLNTTKPVDGVLISHPHQDHYGLLEETPGSWPVYCGQATEKLIRLTSAITGTAPKHTFHCWHGNEPFSAGPFRITPFLTDHSAFDAYMLLVEVGGKRILYSGDFRRHGRKGVLVDRFMAAPPPDIDILLMEGTNLGSNKPWMSEKDLEDDFIELFKKTSGRVFVCWSAQNIDRTVTLYRACLKTGRTLVVDLYTAEVMDLLREQGRLPQPDWRQVKVVITRAFADMYRKTGRESFIERMAKNGIAARKLNETPHQWVTMVRRSLLRDFQAAGVQPDRSDAWSWSMWSGYLDNEDGHHVRAWFERGGANARHIHTSGHASPADLRAFAKSVGPRIMVPIHGAAWDLEADGFPPIRRLKDGEALLI
jgi:ribonuclease J